jgi:hypothetical protein
MSQLRPAPNRFNAPESDPADSADPASASFGADLVPPAAELPPAAEEMTAAELKEMKDQLGITDIADQLAAMNRTLTMIMALLAPSEDQPLEPIPAPKEALADES